MIIILKRCRQLRTRNIAQVSFEDGSFVVRLSTRHGTVIQNGEYTASLIGRFDSLPQAVGAAAEHTELVEFLDP